MLNLIQTEFLKLRRRKIIGIMPLAALIMPSLSFLLFKYVKQTGGDAGQFYRWSAFGYTMFIILPFVLGVFSTLLMYNENQHDMLKQLWIVPVSKKAYFFSKFFVVLIYSICFMLITAAISFTFSNLLGYSTFEWVSILYLLKKCLEIGVLAAFAMIPILAIAAAQKGYILPISIALVYVFLGFMMTSINMYLHPLSSMAAIVMRSGDIAGLSYTQAINVPLAFFSICVWDAVAVLFANRLLSGRK